MLTEDEQLQQAFSRGQQALGQKRDDDAAMRAAYEKYHPSAGGGAAITEGSAKRDISPGATFGSIVGGVAGGVLTAPSGGLGAIPGAIAGAAVGELAQQGYDRMTNSAYAPHSLEESAKRVGTEAAYSAAGEAVGGAITFLRPVAYAQPRQLTAEQLRTKAFLDQHQIPYTPDQITGSAFHSFARSIADNGIFSEKQMEVFAGKQHEAIRRSAVAIADTVGQKVPPDVLGQQIIKTIRNEDDTITKMVIDPLYNRISQDLAYTTKTIQVPSGRMVPHSSGAMGPFGPMMVPEMVDQLTTQGGLLVDQTPVKDLFKKEVASLENAATLQNRPDLLKASNYQSMKRFLDMPDLGQWADAHMVLKETRRNLRELDNPTNVATGVLQDRRVLERAEKVLEQQLEVSLKNSPNPAHQQDLALWQQAQSAVKSKNERLRNDVVLRFVKAMDEHGGEKGLTPFVNTMTPDDALKVMNAIRIDQVRTKGNIKLDDRWLERQVSIPANNSYIITDNPISAGKQLVKEENGIQYVLENSKSSLEAAAWAKYGDNQWMRVGRLTFAKDKNNGQWIPENVAVTPDFQAQGIPRRLGAMAKSAGGEFVDLTRVAGGDVTDAGASLQRQATSKDLIGSMRRQYLQDKIEKAGGMVDADAPFNAEKFRKVLFGKDDLNARKSEVLLDPKQRQKLTEFTNAVSDIQKQDTADKFGSVFIRMKSSGALFSVPLALYGATQIGKGDTKEGLAELGGAAAILISPRVMASLLTNPRATEYMIQGLRYSATSNQAIRVTRELMRLDQGFANAVRLGVSAYNAEQTSGPIHRTAETVQKGMADTTQSIFGNQQ